MKEQLSNLMNELGALKVQPDEPFTWASGYKMPVYNDNRALLASSEARKLICDGFKQSAANELKAADAIAGCATAGIPHATTLADELGLPLGYVRAKAKDHGTKSKLEGFKKAGASVVLVEDLISTGQSSIAAAQALKDEGLNVLCCTAIFSYGFSKSAEAFEKENIPLYTLLTLNDVTWLSPEDKTVLEEWKKDPFNWRSPA